MAKKTLFLCFLFIIISTLPGSIFSHTTVPFDVSASLNRALHVLSSDTMEDQEEISLQKESESSLSLSLHPRASIDKPHFDNYKALTYSRLARDSVRVNSIYSKIERMLNPLSVNKKSSVFETRGLQTPLTSGASQGSGEYFARLAIGKPPKQYYFVTDTGSDVSWLQCNPCIDCYQQSDPVFDPSSSSTYRSLSCNSTQCTQLHTSGCQAGSCLYQVNYGDGSFTFGNLATETLSFGNSGAVNDMTIGCGHDNEGLFVAAAGLLGLGSGPLSITSQLRATSFSYCLVNRDSSASSNLEFNTARQGGAITAPLLHNARTHSYQYVDFSGFVVGGRPVNISPLVFAVDETGQGGVIVDSGTAITRVKTEAYTSLRDAFAAMARDLPPSDGYELFDTCYDLSGRRQANVPTLGFMFSGGKVLQLPPDNYLIPVSADEKYCFAFAPTDGALSIIGNIQQQGIRVTYDLANSVIGFSPRQC